MEQFVKRETKTQGEYSEGDKISAIINRIQENGCYCSLLPRYQNKYGFMPNYLMPSFFDEDGNFKKAVGDQVFVVVNKVSDNGHIILSDIITEEKKQEKNRQKEEKDIIKRQNESFASTYEPGTIFESEVVRVQNSKVIIDLGGIFGIIKKEDTNWNEIDRLENLLFVGETINAVYIKHENGQLFFSLKLLNDKPYDDKLYELSLNELLRFAGHESNVFIGQAKQYHYGLFIENLYSVSENQKGKILIDPIFGYNLRAIVLNTNINVEENKYYRIELKLVPRNRREERNQLFQFVAINIEETENPYKADVDLTFAKSTSPRDCAALARTLDEVGKNMYSSKDRMFFELIQNADDAAAQKGVSVIVKSLGDFLIVRHNGNSFDKDDFDAITSSANGTKKANENKTGYKGIGFKSVFTDSEIVFIKTGGYQFKFDKNEPIFANFEQFYNFVNGYSTEQQKRDFLQKFSSERLKFRGVSDIPWQLEPIWVDNYPKELGDDFTQSNVSIALKLGEYKIIGNNGYNKAIEDIISNPRFMLFLRNTKRIDFNGLSVSKNIKSDVVTLKNSFGNNRVERFKREDFEVEVNNDVFENKSIDIRIVVDEQDELSGKIIEAKFVDTHNQELDNIPKKIAINKSTVISFAVLIDETDSVKPNIECNEVSLFAFLPTLVKDFKFPFYINANFILDPPRQRILGDNPWNFYLMQEIARCLVYWSASLNKKQDKNALNVLLSDYFEEDSADTKQLAEHFNSAYKSSIESEAFILNYKGELSRLDEIVIDIPGLSNLVGEEMFCKFMGTSRKLPSSSIDTSILQEGIFAEKVEKLSLENVLEKITNNIDFNEWFIASTEEQKGTFYRWLNWVKEKGYEPSDGCLKKLVTNLPLFHFGEEYKSCKEIESSGYIVTTEHILPIKDVLTKTGLVCSDTYFDKNHLLFTFIEPQNEIELFHQITIHLLEQDGANLNSEEKLQLFNAFRGFKEVGPATLSSIRLFCNSEGQMSCLNEMFPFNDNAHKWVDPYMISKEDNFDEIQQYLKNESDVIWKNIDVIHIDQEIPIIDIYNTYPWTDEKYTRNLIDKYGPFNDMESLLPIVESSSISTKEYFLNSIKKLELLSTSTYNKDSYEYRVFQLVLSVYSKPSDFSSKIYFDGQCIKDFSVSDDVVCDFYQNGETRKLKMSLAKLLPQYQNQSDSIDKIKALFEIKKDLDKLFLAKPMPIYQIIKELESSDYLNLKPGIWPTDKGGNALQYLFYVYYYRQVKDYTSTWVISINLEEESSSFVLELMNFLYNNKIDIRISPFTYRLKKYFVDKYFDSDYIFCDEQLLPTIEKWADDEKKIKYLKDNGVQTSDCNAIQFRKLFLEDKPINFIEKLSDGDIKLGIEFIAMASDFERPFVGENQKNILLSLKDRCNDLLDNWDDKKMEVKAIEWTSKEYKKWIEEHYPYIFIYPGILPCQLSYTDEILLKYEDLESYYYYDKQAQKLFVSNARKIEDILFEVAKEGKSDFDFDDYKELCLEGKVSFSQEDIEKKDKTIESLSESNRIKDKIIEQYRAIYGELTDEGNLSTKKPQVLESNSIENIYSNAQTEIGLQKGKVIERDALSRDKQAIAHKEAENVIKERLENDGYDCSNWILDEDNNDSFKKWQSVNQVRNIVNPQKETINLVVKSAKGGYIYLSATDFEFLTSNSNNVLMVWDGKNVHSVTSEEIFNKDSNVNLIFDTEYTPKHYYAALSKVFQYVKRTTFAVKNPSYNAYDTIKSFGMDSKTEGVQELFDDNDL